MRNRWALPLIVLLACGDSDPEVDAALDPDAGVDARIPVDAGADAQVDGGSDASPGDAGADALEDDAALDPDAAPVLDRDGDGVDDDEDAFPDDPAEWIDSDADGVGNGAQADEDGDGVLDINDELPFDPDASSLVEQALPGDGTPAAAMAPPFRARTAAGEEVLGVIPILAEAQRTVGFRVEGDPAGEVILNVVASSTTGSNEPLDEIDALIEGAQLWAWTPPTTEAYDVVLTTRSESGVSAAVTVYFDG
ncbi:MAG: thrombospondin type 3 repeat-containing protein, partial [Myxococcota bacterium]